MCSTYISHKHIHRYIQKHIYKNIYKYIHKNINKHIHTSIYTSTWFNIQQIWNVLRITVWIFYKTEVLHKSVTHTNNRFDTLWVYRYTQGVQCIIQGLQKVSLKLKIVRYRYTQGEHCIIHAMPRHMHIHKYKYIN